MRRKMECLKTFVMFVCILYILLLLLLNYILVIHVIKCRILGLGFYLGMELYFKVIFIMNVLKIVKYVKAVFSERGTVFTFLDYVIEISASFIMIYLT